MSRRGVSPEPRGAPPIDPTHSVGPCLGVGVRKRVQTSPVGVYLVWPNLGSRIGCKFAAKPGLSLTETLHFTVVGSHLQKGEMELLRLKHTGTCCLERVGFVSRICGGRGVERGDLWFECDQAFSPLDGLRHLALGCQGGRERNHTTSLVPDTCPRPRLHSCPDSPWS